MKTWYLFDIVERKVYYHYDRRRRLGHLGTSMGTEEGYENKAGFRRCEWGEYNPNHCGFSRKEAAEIQWAKLPYSDLEVIDRETLFKRMKLEDDYWPHLASAPTAEEHRRAQAQAQADHLRKLQLAPRRNEACFVL